MTNLEDLRLLKQGALAWNRSRPETPNLRSADLSGLDLADFNFKDTDLISARMVGCRLNGSNFRRARLDHADLSDTTLDGASFRRALAENTVFVGSTADQADFSYADLSGANFAGARLVRSNFYGATLDGSNLSGADFSGSCLSGCRLTPLPSKTLGDDIALKDLLPGMIDILSEQGADTVDFPPTEVSGDGTPTDLTDTVLIGADLSRAVFDRTRIQGARLNGAMVYGSTAWDLEGEPAEQEDLRITPPGDKQITIGDLKVAQFVYMVSRNREIGDILDTITRKAVLILGRFTPARKDVLEAVRDRLREMNLAPMIFDWKKPTRRDLTETVQLLANISRFVVADVTDAKSIPQELSHIVPFLRSVPVRPIILSSEYEYSMFEHWTGYPTMLPVFRYEDQRHLINNIHEALIQPIEEWEAGYDDKKALEDEIARLRVENARLKDGGNG